MTTLNDETVSPFYYSEPSDELMDLSEGNPIDLIDYDQDVEIVETNGLRLALTHLAPEHITLPAGWEGYTTMHVYDGSVGDDYHIYEILNG